MRYALLVALVGAGCYSAPDYEGTRFKCDAEHGCPPGQTCIDGFCSPGGGSDGGATGDTASQSGVACGAMTCGGGQKCCADVLGGPSCIPIASTCAGLSATCDGVEDCNGNPCCDGNPIIMCGVACANQVCRDAADCTNPGQQACCFGLGTNEPWGRCLSSCP